MSSTDLLGKKAIITNKESSEYGQWGIVERFYQDYFYISMEGCGFMLGFYRWEFEITNKDTNNVISG